MPIDDRVFEYRRILAANTPPFLLPRRFVATESWTKAATEGGTRYLGFVRENEPDLPAILVHRQVVILGEAGAGKSTAAQAIIQHILSTGGPTSLPVFASLKSYEGNLRELLLTSAPEPVLHADGVTRTYIFDGIDEVPAACRGTLRRELNELLTAEPTARLALTARQAFYAQHPDAFPDELIAYHLVDFDNKDVRACAKHEGVDADLFLTAVANVDCEEEIRNPFVLNVMLQRYKDDGSLSPLRSDNVGYVVDPLIQSRPMKGIADARDHLRDSGTQRTNRRRVIANSGRGDRNRPSGR